MKPRSEKSIELYHELLDRGYPEQLCYLISEELNTDYTAGRMLGYLSYHSRLPEGEIVDEMLAILSDRKTYVDKKIAEQANAHINEMFRFGNLFDEDEE